MMSSEEYEVLYTLRSELAKKGINPGVFGLGGCSAPGPWGFGGPAHFGPWGFGGSAHFGPWGCSGSGPFGPGSRHGWMKDITPAEMGVLMKYRGKGRQRAVVGGIVGASAMVGVWKVAALGGFMGVAGVIMGGAIGARVSVRTSGIRQEMFTEMLKLPSERSPRAAHARDIIRQKLPHNAFAQELLK
ncbi:uncharacterized protein IUM83_07959 [Phytophthora cinnamomi]|uniref:uncharacterized protein n=1 Tax=Phytophthora cinnamomi TaxID=4785 RepID=UPI00355A9690|nr:hypothetical protein IUM83_07959 [Phytophthora cinnamomi]